VPTLAEQGFRLPAEWEPHAATWLAWPHQRADWPGKFNVIPWVYVEIVRHLHAAERVHILVQSPAVRRQAERKLRHAGVDLGRVDFHEILMDRGWVRDSGPLGVVRDTATGREAALVRFGFNAWAKYDNWHRDAELPALVGQALGLPVVAATRPDGSGRPAILEGGSIDGNSQGCLLTTEECLLSDVQQRNPGLTRADYERLFADYFGIRKVLWLGRGIAGDDTHGHVDDLARFVGPRTVVAVVEDDPADVNYAPLRENLERLRGATDPDGRLLEVVPLPMPRPLGFDGQRLPASYANFYIANDRVLVPTFNDPNDRRALGVLAELFPDRTVLGIHAVDLVWGLGTLHCLTQQEPVGRPAAVVTSGCP
jgi:agmatine deiminase